MWLEPHVEDLAQELQDPEGSHAVCSRMVSADSASPWVLASFFFIPYSCLLPKAKKSGHWQASFSCYK